MRGSSLASAETDRLRKTVLDREEELSGQKRALDSHEADKGYVRCAGASVPLSRTDSPTDAAQRQHPGVGSAAAQCPGEPADRQAG